MAGTSSPDLWYIREYVERERKEAADYADGKLPMKNVSNVQGRSGNGNILHYVRQKRARLGREHLEQRLRY